MAKKKIILPEYRKPRMKFETFTPDRTSVTPRADSKRFAAPQHPETLGKTRAEAARILLEKRRRRSKL